MTLEAAYERASNATRLFLRSARARKLRSAARTLNYDHRFRDIVDAISKEFEESASTAPKQQKETA